jgi:outer membrane protein assembly factor BamE
MRKALLVLLALLISGCSWFQPYHKPIQQGNTIKDYQVNQLRIGMPEFEVKQIMGEPVLVNAFANDRLDYVYTFKSKAEFQQKKVILSFRNKQLSNIQQQ